MFFLQNKEEQLFQWMKENNCTYNFSITYSSCIKRLNNIPLNLKSDDLKRYIYIFFLFIKNKKSTKEDCLFYFNRFVSTIKNEFSFYKKEHKKCVILQRKYSPYLSRFIKELCILEQNMENTFSLLSSQISEKNSQSLKN